MWQLQSHSMRSSAGCHLLGMFWGTHWVRTLRIFRERMVSFLDSDLEEVPDEKETQVTSMMLNTGWPETALFMFKLLHRCVRAEWAGEAKATPGTVPGNSVEAISWDHVLGLFISCNIVPPESTETRLLRKQPPKKTQFFFLFAFFPKKYQTIVSVM